MHVVCINDCGLYRVGGMYFRSLGEKNVGSWLGFMGADGNCKFATTVTSFPQYVRFYKR